MLGSFDNPHRRMILFATHLMSDSVKHVEFDDTFFLQVLRRERGRGNDTSIMHERYSPLLSICSYSTSAADVSRKCVRSSLCSQERGDLQQVGLHVGEGCPEEENNWRIYRSAGKPVNTTECPGVDLNAWSTTKH